MFYIRLYVLYKVVRFMIAWSKYDRFSIIIEMWFCSQIIWINKVLVTKYIVCHPCCVCCYSSERQQCTSHKHGVTALAIPVQWYTAYYVIMNQFIRSWRGKNIKSHTTNSIAAIYVNKTIASAECIVDTCEFYILHLFRYPRYPREKSLLKCNF